MSIEGDEDLRCSGRRRCCCSPACTASSQVQQAIHLEDVETGSTGSSTDGQVSLRVPLPSPRAPSRPLALAILSAPIRLLRHHTDLILGARRLIVPAGKATAAPPIGPALGARGVKSIDFVKEFNGQSLPFVRAVGARTDVQPNPTAQTANLTPGTPTPVSITIQPDRTFTFVTKTPPTMWLVKQAAGIETASGEAGRPNVAPAGTLSVKHVYEIARIKQRDEHLRHVPLEAIAKSVVGQCKSAGVAVVP